MEISHRLSVDGKGTGSKEFLKLANSEALEADILAGNNIERIEYSAGNGPLSVKVVDPLRVPSGTYQFHICDQNYIWSKDSLTGA